MGEWLSSTYQKDVKNEFFNPLVCLSTNRKETIDEEMKILVKDQSYNVKFVEVYNMDNLEGKVRPTQISTNFCFYGKAAYKSNKEREVQTGLSEESSPLDQKSVVVVKNP